MAENPDEKPAFRYVSVIEIESGVHGLLRFRNWTVKASTAIDKVCNADLTPRRFAEDLYVQLATDPLLTEADVQQWADVELLDVAAKWWDVVEHRRPSPIPFDSLEGFQDAVRQRSAEHRKSLTSSIEKMAVLRFHMPERSAIERLTEGIAKQHRMLLEFTGHSEIQKAIERMHFAAQSPTAAALREITLARPERLALESIHERMREAQMLAGAQAIEIARFAAVKSPLAEYAAQAEKMHREMADRLRGYEVAFDASRLKGVLDDLDLTAYKRFMPDLTALESVAASFKTPWIDRLRPEVSVMSVARMSALSAAAQTSNPFAAASVTTIREALGDWREVTMPWRLLPDTNLREQFYIDHGFDGNLVRLPEPAFSEALHNLGLVRPRTPPEAEQIDEEEILRQRMAQVYTLLFRLERGLRTYIDRVMIQKYGDDWERHRCHGNGQIYKKWFQKRDLAVQSGLQPQRLIQYADFTEYADLITKADNWKEVFQEAFDRPESVRESFHRLGPVRLCTMHARAITKTEVTLAIAEITRLLIAIGDVDGNEDSG
jgi:hypothetical protein